MSDSSKRFRVAFSFAGEKRDFVAHVASVLAAQFGQEAILYYKYHESEFSRRDLGIYLPDLYHDQSDLIVVVVCPDYDEKEWTGLEWTAIHALLKKRKDSDVMLCRFEYAEVKGLYDTAGFVELDSKTPEQTATLILERLALNEGKPKDHFIVQWGDRSARDRPTTRTPAGADPISTPPAFLGDLPDLNFDRQPVLAQTVDQLDSSVITRFLEMPLSREQLERVDLDAKLTSGTLLEKLNALGCVCDGHPTLGAFLCFAPRSLLFDKFGACSLQMVRYEHVKKGAAKASITTEQGNLISLYEGGMSWLKTAAGLRRRGRIGRPDRDELEIPELVLREALANALVHRDYETGELRDQPTRLEVYPNRIEVTSFGNLPTDVPVELLNSDTDKIVPLRRNYVIASIFQCMSHVELNASGVPRMRLEMEKASLAFPKFIDDLDGRTVRVVMLRPVVEGEDDDVIPATRSPMPGQYRVVISSTITDLQEHRKQAVIACFRQGVFPAEIDYSPITDANSIQASIMMVDAADLFIGIYAWRYGSIPDGQSISIQEIEFNRAVEQGIPILAFVMHDDHPITRGMLERSAKFERELIRFKKKVKATHRTVEFKSPEDLRSKITVALANWSQEIEKSPRIESAVHTPDTTDAEPDPIPTPPAFYAEPAYIGSHEFVGRRSQLETLSDWAAPADAHPVLLFEAIGGAGKSMLTWEWTTDHATAVRGDWAGRFWYSFYERGAIMADFCRRALAYITGQPLKDFRKKKTPELSDLLLRHLQARPWLLVLDGLERMLVAYQRIDAAQLRDEEADAPTDQIAHRDPCAAIRPEDDDLLRALAGAGPSKLLLTSRLIPRVLLNVSSQAIPGVLRERLPGLRPADAEALLRSCGVTGDSQNIQRYLKSHCDCHPLVTGVLAGLINDYLPDKGNFDAWLADPDAGSGLNLAKLDLVQKRNHILTAALDALSQEGRELLSTLSLLSEAVDYSTLSAFNPHVPPEPEKLAITVRDLEQRGLLQYDAPTKRHDLHPVVRSVVVGSLQQEEKNRFGQHVVDHFSRQAHNPYEEAETLEDVRDGVHVVRTLLQMGRHQQACYAYRGDLANALLINLEAGAETLSLLRPFFPQGWATLPNDLDARDGGYLANDAGIALHSAGEPEEALAAYTADLQACLREADQTGVRVDLSNISQLLADENLLARMERCLLFAIDIAAQRRDLGSLFRARLDRFGQLATLGQWTDAEAMWELLDPMGRDWSRSVYRTGEAEYQYAVLRFRQGQLTEEHLASAEQLAKQGKSRLIIRSVHGLRGAWQLERRQHKLAAESLHEAVRMAREVGKTDANAETQLAISRFHLNQLPDPRETAEQLAQAKWPSHRGMAELWLAIGDLDQAKHHALKAYEWAWADGEPYVRRYELDRSRALLEQLGAEIPDLPAYDPAKAEKFPWEDELVGAIEKLRAEKEARETAEESEKQ